MKKHDGILKSRPRFVQKRMNLNFQIWLT